MSLGPRVAILCAAIALLAGCGSDELPDGAVATVGDVEIPKADLDSALKLNGAQPGDRVAVRRAMQSLIQAEWIEQEADERDISVDAGSLRQAALKLVAQGGTPVTEDSLGKALERMGLRERDVLRNLRATELRRRLFAPALSVSEREVDEYYRVHRRRFLAPEARSLRIVPTDTRSDANSAKQALADGAPWMAVFRRYAADTAARLGGDRVVLNENDGDEALNHAAFAADVGRLSGPVKTQFGWIVFRVESVDPHEQTVARSKEIIRGLLRYQQLHALRSDLVATYRSQTICADQYRVPQCDSS